MKRRDLIKGLLATSTLPALHTVEAMEQLTPTDFWKAIRLSLPKTSQSTNLLHTGGGTVPLETLKQLAEFQATAAGVDQFKKHELQVLRELKESGSSTALRQQMASTFGCSMKEIALTRNAMEGLGIGLLGVDLNKGDEIVTTTADYDSCIKIIQQREQREGVRLKLIDIPMHAADDNEVVAAFEQACTAKTKLILMCHMFNKNGQILPVSKISKMAREKGIVTVVDGAQSIGHIDFKLSDLDCDIFAASLHKWFWGPRGTGLLYVREEMIPHVWPIWASWSDKPANSIEKFEEFGTVSKAVSACLPSVFELHHKIGAQRKEARLRYLRDLWLNEITKSSRVNLLTHPQKSCAITAFKIDGIEPDKFADYLYEKHKIEIGSIHLQDKPNFTGNYLAADLSNTEEDIYRFIDVFNTYIKNH